jgi:hypothetical protein
MERAYQAIGGGLLVVAFALGLHASTWMPSGPAPTHSLARAAGGCAIAAGLCFVAAAIASRGDRGRDQAS